MPIGTPMITAPAVTYKLPMIIGKIPNSSLLGRHISPVMEKLVEAYKKVNPNANVELQSSDSTTGMTSAIEGSYDIGMASRELKDEEKEKLEGTVIATDGIAVIVNKANPTEEMTSDQVKSIYLGDVLTWDEIAE